jgi:hypothetical protein
MTYPSTDMDRISRDLHEMAKSYAAKAASPARDPYFREAVVKSSVSGFAWALYHAFEDDFSRAALNHEMKVQSAAIDRAMDGTERAPH